jgi:hypothetical protein
MACSSCRSINVTEFGAEINIHFSGRESVDKPTVMIFPKLVVCLDCGFAHCAVPEPKLRQLAEGARSSV